MSEFDEVPRLSSQAESQFYRALKQAVGENYAIRAKARIGETVQPEGAQSIEAFRVMKDKYFDFLLCDPKSGVIRCIIMMSNPSQQLKESQERDGYLETLCADVDLPLMFEARQNKYDYHAIRRRIEEKLGRRLADADEAGAGAGAGAGGGMASSGTDSAPTRRIARPTARAEDVPVYIPQGGGFFKKLVKLLIFLIILLAGLLAFQKFQPYYAMKYLPTPVYRVLDRILDLVDRPKARARAANGVMCWQDENGNKIYGNVQPSGQKMRPCN